ncbi:hypothetical protein DRP77_10845 [Candidatus Poribacteria bacterium]|nr:MAG: hypothetical protein DRP77_10845 [Candidatus Poribacteria bacterium]
MRKLKSLKVVEVWEEDGAFGYDPTAYLMIRFYAGRLNKEEAYIFLHLAKQAEREGYGGIEDSEAWIHVYFGTAIMDIRSRKLYLLEASGTTENIREWIADEGIKPTERRMRKYAISDAADMAYDDIQTILSWIESLKGEKATIPGVVV